MAPLFNHQGQMTGAHLFFPDRAQVTVEEAAPAHPFALPISPVSDLLLFTPDSAWNHRVHIRGTVTWPGRAAYSAFRTAFTVFVRRPTKRTR
jgi:hypothetical protein